MKLTTRFPSDSRTNDSDFTVLRTNLPVVCGAQLEAWANCGIPKAA
jgi:hypothetical protein